MKKEKKGLGGGASGEDVRVAGHRPETSIEGGALSQRFGDTSKDPKKSNGRCH